MTKQEILSKIEKQSGYINVVDALILTSVFTDEFGVVNTNMATEDELRWMYMKLKGWTESDNDKYEKHLLKTCTQCNIEKRHIKFKRSYYKNIRSREAICIECKEKNKNKV